ncbi:MAG TPA: alpha/beta hydrolase, partial [Pseudolabrys sp.]|nr:alpha/beta hydrolase [Pseudolabrys sp.]
RVPLLALHGELDRIVPIRFGEKLFSLAGEPKRMVRFPQAGHVNLDNYGAEKAVRVFLREVVPAAS